MCWKGRRKWVLFIDTPLFLPVPVPTLEKRNDDEIAGFFFPSRIFFLQRDRPTILVAKGEGRRRRRQIGPIQRAFLAPNTRRRKRI